MVIEKEEIQFLINYVKQSPEFKKIFDKTQVLNDPNDPDNTTNRGIHTLQVAQTAKSLAAELQSRGIKNPDGREICPEIAELIGLCHDLGHTPFGHEGERQIDLCVSEYKPSEAYRRKREENFGKEYVAQDSEQNMIYEHNEHSAEVFIAICKRCERKFEDMFGKKLDLGVIDYVVQGILAHSTSRVENTPVGIEQQAVRLGDKIAYVNTDINDLLVNGFITEKDIPTDLRDFANLKPQDRIDMCIKDSADEYQLSMDDKEKKYPEMTGKNSTMRKCYEFKPLVAEVIKKFGKKEHPGFGNDEKKTQGQIKILFDYYMEHYDDYVENRERGNIGKLRDQIKEIGKKLKQKDLSPNDKVNLQGKLADSTRRVEGHGLVKIEKEYAGYPKEQKVAFLIANLGNKDVRAMVTELEVGKFLGNQANRAKEDDKKPSKPKSVARRVEGIEREGKVMRANSENRASTAKREEWGQRVAGRPKQKTDAIKMNEKKRTQVIARRVEIPTAVKEVEKPLEISDNELSATVQPEKEETRTELPKENSVGMHISEKTMGNTEVKSDKLINNIEVSKPSEQPKLQVDPVNDTNEPVTNSTEAGQKALIVDKENFKNVFLKFIDRGKGMLSNVITRFNEYISKTNDTKELKSEAKLTDGDR